MVENVLCKLLKHEDIGRTGDNALYLRRFFLYGAAKGRENFGARLLLHRFHRGDEDAARHDHPWPFISLILSGGYWEETLLTEIPPESQGKPKWTLYVDGELRCRIWYGPGSLLIRRSTHAHRVILLDGQKAWTLVWTAKKVRSWGFWTPKGWCHWRTYIKGLEWCGKEGSKWTKS